MKKITTILMLLVLTCMGVWAQGTTVWFKQANDGNNVTRGTFHNNDGSVNTNPSAFVFFWKSGTDEPVITLRASNNPQNVGVMARENSRLTANGNPTYEISVSEGYIIKSYYIKFINFNDATKPKTLTTEIGPSAVTEGSERGNGSGNPKDAEVTVTDVNKVATTFTVSSADDKAIKIKEFYVVVEEKSDYTDQINTNIKPWIESIGNGYFTLNGNNTAVQALRTTYNAHTDDTWSKTDYNSLLDLLNAAKASENAYIMPETGYYRIKNNALDFYAGYSEGSNPAADNRATGASTVVYLEKDETTGKYAIKINGKYIQTTGINYNSGGTFTMGDDVAYFNVFARGNINSDGKGTGSFTALDDESGTNRSYLIIENSPAPSHGTPLTAYGPGKIGSHWILEVATTLELSLTNIDGKNYATTCLPFPVKLSEEAAYKVTINGKKAVEEPIGDVIPANIPVLLISDASTTLTATIQETTATVDCGDLKGVLFKTAKTDLQGETPVVLNQSKGKVGFYKLADGSSLSANRAYLSYVEGTTSPSSKAFFEEGFELGGNEATAIENIENGAFENGAVYNLQGQRVGKAQKGVYIINNKKVVVK